jgi:hypothetical protein
MIIRNLWDSVHEADANSDLKIKTATLKMIADIEGKRIEMLQKSGLLENQQIADQVLEMERKHEIIIAILRKVTEKYPEAAEYVRQEIAKVTGEVVGTVVD